MTGGARHMVFSVHDSAVPSTLSSAELDGCKRCRSLSRLHAVEAETALLAAHAYSQAAACAEPADAAVLLDAASGELEDAELYFNLAAYAVRSCRMTAVMNGKALLVRSSAGGYEIVGHDGRAERAGTA